MKITTTYVVGYLLFFFWAVVSLAMLLWWVSSMIPEQSFATAIVPRGIATAYASAKMLVYARLVAYRDRGLFTLMLFPMPISQADDKGDRD